MKIQLGRWILHFLGYGIYRLPARRVTELDIPDRRFYTPLFSPWQGFGDFTEYYSVAQPHTLVSADRCYILLSLARQSSSLPGDWVECGVYKGGTAMLLAKILRDRGLGKKLHLFDTFTGMPQTDPNVDLHKMGDFDDTSLESVEANLRMVAGEAGSRVFFHPGLIPETFRGCAVGPISFAHVDVDIFSAVLDCCEFIYPRLVGGGFLVFDDYGFDSCPGARKAVDQFFRGKPEIPIVLPTGQALVVKCPTEPQH